MNTYHAHLFTPKKEGFPVARIHHGSAAMLLCRPNTKYLTSHWRSLKEAEQAARAWVKSMQTRADTYQKDEGGNTTNRKAWKFNKTTGRVTSRNY